MTATPDSLDSDLSRFPVHPQSRFTLEELGMKEEDRAAACAMNPDTFIRAEDIAMRKLQHGGEISGLDRVLAINKVSFWASALGMELVVVESHDG
jgi:hypothetical protein